MDFVSIRIITDDVARLASFYEHATGVQASWSNENFAELTTTSATLAIASTRTVPLFGPGSARPADNHTVIIEFLVDDVDKEFERLKSLVSEWVQEPTTMPWGNRSIFPRPRWQPRLSLYPRHRGRDQEVPGADGRSPSRRWVSKCRQAWRRNRGAIRAHNPKGAVVAIGTDHEAGFLSLSSAGHRRWLLSSSIEPCRNR